MGESRRHVHLPEGLARQTDPDPAGETRRAAPDVHGHIEDLPVHHPDQLPLRPTPLRVQPAQRAARGPGEVVLHERHLDPPHPVLPLVVRL